MGMFCSGVGLQSGCARACMPPYDKASVAGQLVSTMFWLVEGRPPHLASGWLAM